MFVNQDPNWWDTLLYYLYHWTGFNEELLLYIYGIRGENYDLLMHSFTQLGRHENFLMYFGTLAAGVALSLIYRLIAGKDNRHFIALWLGVLSVFAASILVHGVGILVMKNYSDVPRPYIVLASEGVQGMDLKTNREDDFKSFPSGHVAFTMLMVMALWPALPGSLRKLGVVLVLLMAWSRMSLGMHFPADIIWTLLLTLFVVRIIRRVVHDAYRRLFKINCIS